MFASCQGFFFFFFFFNDTATTEIYTLSLHDALPIYAQIIKNLGTQKTDRSNINGIWDLIDDYVVPFRSEIGRAHV